MNMQVFQRARPKMAFVRNILVYSLLAFFVTGTTLASSAQENETRIGIDVESLKDELSQFHRSPELASEIGKIIETLENDTPVATRIDLDLWKLKALGDVSNAQAAADFAYEIYKKYNREEYVSEQQFGDTMQQIVQAVSKTEDIALAFEIIQQLRESLYQDPSTYLSFIVDKSFMEIHIETFDYQRALDIELAILNNPDYMALDVVRDWRYALFNEVAFLYNRLGNGNKALEYVDMSQAALEEISFHPADLTKARALSFGNRGRAYLLIGDYVQAKEMGVAVLETGEELEQHYLVALGNRIIGSAAFHLGDDELAFEALTKGIELAETHEITTMQKYLYKDYALLYEQRGDFEMALAWQKKQFALEVEAQKAAANARSALGNAEFLAFETSQEILNLQHAHEDQQAIAGKDSWIKTLLMTIVVFLLAAGGILTKLIFSLRKGRKELIKSKDEAHLANQMKSDFLASMSHELRTPMNGVLGMAQVLRETPLNEKQKLYVDTMHSSGQSLLAVINDILDFSKIEANKMDLNIEPCHLEDKLQFVVNSMIPSAAEKKLDLRFHYDPELPKNHLVDSERLRQIVTNLVGNAIKFTHEGHVQVNVTGQIIDLQSFIKIDVTDTGIGIDRDKFDLIFEKFTQAEGSTTRRFGGTGLGLAISRKLAEAMKGRLVVTSELGVGSTFTLEIPVNAVSPSTGTRQAPAETTEAATISSQTSTVKTPATKAASKNTLKILVASNDQNYRHTVETVFQHPRMELTFTGNTIAALKNCHASRFNLVLLDAPSSLEAGLVALRTIRRDEHQPGGTKTPIICTLDQTLMARKQALLAAGMDAAVQKPLQKKALADTVIFWLRANIANKSRPAA